MKSLGPTKLQVTSLVCNGCIGLQSIIHTHSSTYVLGFYKCVYSDMLLDNLDSRREQYIKTPGTCPIVVSRKKRNRFPFSRIKTFDNGI